MENVRAAGAPAPSVAEAIAGALLSLLVPLVGLVVGGVWLARGGRSAIAGAAALALGLAGLAFWVGFTYAS
jgi:hypothetical protein